MSPVAGNTSCICSWQTQEADRIAKTRTHVRTYALLQVASWAQPFGAIWQNTSLRDHRTHTPTHTHPMRRRKVYPCIRHKLCCLCCQQHPPSLVRVWLMQRGSLPCSCAKGKSIAWVKPAPTPQNTQTHARMHAMGRFVPTQAEEMGLTHNTTHVQIQTHTCTSYTHHNYCRHAAASHASA